MEDVAYVVKLHRSEQKVVLGIRLPFANEWQIYSCGIGFLHTKVALNSQFSSFYSVCELAITNIQRGKGSTKSGFRPWYSLWREVLPYPHGTEHKLQHLQLPRQSINSILMFSTLKKSGVIIRIRPSTRVDSQLLPLFPRTTLIDCRILVKGMPRKNILQCMLLCSCMENSTKKNNTDSLSCGGGGSTDQTPVGPLCQTRSILQGTTVMHFSIYTEACNNNSKPRTFSLAIFVMGNY